MYRRRMPWLSLLLLLCFSIGSVLPRGTHAAVPVPPVTRPVAVPKNTLPLQSAPVIRSTPTCTLAPIALHQTTLTNKPIGAELANVLHGTGAGQFGWLSWTGRQDAATLAASLTPPGDSPTYTNPEHATDHVVSVGDWVRGSAGVSNSRGVRDALDRLMAVESIVPV